MLSFQLFDGGCCFQGDEQPACNKQWALCIFDDLLEFASEVSVYSPTYQCSHTPLSAACNKLPAVLLTTAYEMYMR